MFSHPFWNQGSSQPYQGFSNGQESANASTCCNRAICFSRVLFSLEVLVVFHGRGYHSRVVGKALNFFKSYTKCCTPKRSITQESCKWQTSNEFTQRSALYPDLFGYAVAFCYQLHLKAPKQCSLWKPVPKRSWMRCLQRM